MTDGKFMGITDERWRYLEANQMARLTDDEIEAGWHFCYDWDGLLVNRYDTEGEGAACTCFSQSQCGLPGSPDQPV